MSQNVEIMRTRPTEPLGSLIGEAQWHSIGKALGLSAPELQIVRCLFNGKKEAATALELRISVHTVHTHIGRMYRKLGVSDRCQLLLQAVAVYLQDSRPSTAVTSG